MAKELSAFTPNYMKDENDGTTVELEVGGNAVDEIKEMPALGRPFRLGMLYDIRRNCICPGENIFPYTSIEENTMIKDAPGMHCSVALGDSIEEKAKSCGNDKELQKSIMFGLTQTGSSGKVLTAPKSTDNKVKAVLSITLTTKYGEIDVPFLFDQRKNHVLSTTINATHVVCAMQYGGNVSFEYEKTVEKNENREETINKMNEAVSFLKLYENTKDSGTTNEESEMKEYETISCKFYGDLILQTIPTTYPESVTVFKQITSYLETGAPVKVWLYPLSRLIPKKTPLQKAIGDLETSNLLRFKDDIQKMSSEIKTMIGKSPSIFILDVSSRLHSVYDELQKIEENLGYHVLMLSQDERRVDTPFDPKPIEMKKKWMVNAAREIDMLETYIYRLREKELIVRDSAELEEKIFESEKLVHLTVSLPLLRDKQSSDDKRVISNTLLVAEGKKSKVQDMGIHSKLQLPPQKGHFDDGTWMGNANFKNLFRRYIMQSIKSADERDDTSYAVTIVDIKSTLNQVDCFHIDVYQSGDISNEPNFNFFA